MILYTCHPIRGSQGEEASEAYQKLNIQLAVERASVLRDHFQEITWVIPHENDIVNELYFQGKVSGNDIVDVECGLIRDRYDGVVVVGSYQSGTGVGREIRAAADAGKFICFIEGVDEDDRMLLAQDIAGWEVKEMI